MSITPVHPVVATDALRCLGWRQESILRLLENNLANAEDPENLIIYGGRQKAARDWDSYHSIVRELMRLEADQTLVVQSGKPIGVFRTTEDTPLVIIVNGVTTQSTPEEDLGLLRAGLSMLGGMTAGTWQYIGSQGIIQGTYETFTEVARQHLGGSLIGRTILTAGSGGMGGGQPLAGKLAGASILVADVEAPKLQRRVDEGYLDAFSTDIGEAIDLWLAAASSGRAASTGVAANIVDVNAELARRGIVPDIVTDQTTTEALGGYIPRGMSEQQALAMREADPAELQRRADETVREHMQAMLEYQRGGAIVFEYGNHLRKRARDAGVADAFEVGGFIEKFIRPMFCEGVGPFRWMAISGDPEDILRIDARLGEVFADVPRIVDWLGKAHRIQFTGLPARICWMGHTERTRAALEINRMIADGEIAGPIAFSRDHLDAGSVTDRYRETENMADGSDVVADWPLINAILNGIAGADLTSINAFGGNTLNSGPTTIADGTDAAAERLRRVMDADTGLGVLRQADAGFPRAMAARDRHGLGLRE